MALRGTSGTVVFERALGIPNSSDTTGSMGVWIKATAFPVTEFTFLEYGVDLVHVTLTSAGQFKLYAGGGLVGTTAISGGIDLNRWYFVVHTRTSSTTHKLKLCRVNDDDTVSAVTTEITATAAINVQTNCWFKVTCSNTIYICNARFGKSGGGETAIVNERSSWAFGASTTLFAWQSVLRHPLDLYGYGGTGSSTNLTFPNTRMWTSVSGAVTRVSDPAHLVGRRCMASIMTETTGLQVGHAPAAGIVTTDALLDWEISDDGLIPATIREGDFTVGPYVSMGCQGLTVGSIGAHPDPIGYYEMPRESGDAYEGGSGTYISGRYQSGELGAIGNEPCGGAGMAPPDCHFLTRVDIFDFSLNIRVQWNNGGLSGDCRTIAIDYVTTDISFIGDYDDAEPPTPPDVPYDPNTSPCRDDNRAWWFDDFDDTVSLTPTYSVSGSITLTPTGGIDGTQAVTGSGGLVRLVSPDQRSFSVSFRHKF